MRYIWFVMKVRKYLTNSNLLYLIVQLEIPRSTVGLPFLCLHKLRTRVPSDERRPISREARPPPVAQLSTNERLHLVLFRAQKRGSLDCKRTFSLKMKRAQREMTPRGKLSWAAVPGKGNSYWTNYIGPICLKLFFCLSSRATCRIFISDQEPQMVYRQGRHTHNQRRKDQLRNNE